MSTPAREGETIEGSRTMRNRPYQVLKCSERLEHLLGFQNFSPVSPSHSAVNTEGPRSCGAPGASVDLKVELDECVKAAGASTEYGVCCAAARAAHTVF